MGKIINDKYYTPIDVANKCIDTTLRVVGKEQIKEVVEPSVGAGAFLHNENLLVDVAYDIEPECNDSKCKIIKGDYLSQVIGYKEGRLIMGNPPYGERMLLAQKFYKKAVIEGDYVAFILPISQLNNTQSLYEFDLIYSEDLGEQVYSGVELHCCFNIYKRPSSGSLNKRVTTRLKDITIYRQDSRDYDKKEFDIRMCYWGNGSAGKILKDNEHYSAEYKIKVNNDSLREAIITCLETFNWKEYLNCIAMRKIQQFHIMQVLKENVQGIK